MTRRVDQEIIDKYPIPDGWVVEPGDSREFFNVTLCAEDRVADSWYVYDDKEMSVFEYVYNIPGRSSTHTKHHRYPVTDAEDAMRLIQALILFGGQP